MSATMKKSTASTKKVMGKIARVSEIIASYSR